MRIECTMSSIDVPPRSQRPIEPAKSVSPVSSVDRSAVVDLETDAAGRVSRRVQHAAAHAPGFEQIAVAQVAVERDDRRRVRQPDPARLQRQRSVERQVGGMKKPLPPVSSRRRPRSPMWSMCACVWTKNFARQPMRLQGGRRPRRRRRRHRRRSRRRSSRRRRSCSCRRAGQPQRS